MTIKKHIFCQCMKPWTICANKNNSYRLDVRDLIDTYSLKSQNYYHIPKSVHKYISLNFLDYDFINKKWLLEKFQCRFRDNTKK